MKYKIRKFAQPVSSDIGPKVRLDTQIIDGLINRCVIRSTEALKVHVSSHSELDRDHLSALIEAMQHTHKNIRLLLSPGEPRPASVDALSLSRLQLESLYAICLMLEDRKWVELYAKNGWEKLYERYLLEREECKKLPRFIGGLKAMEPYIDGLQHISGVSDVERKTIESEELGIPMPKGIHEMRIKQFPTPGKIIEQIADQDCKKMLVRLYAEYEYLSSYVHGLPDAVSYKEIFGKHKHRFSTGRTEDIFQKRIVGPSLSLSWLTVVQSASELICLYPQDIELRATITEAWNKLLNHWILAKIIWEIRAKTLLGSVQ